MKRRSALLAVAILCGAVAAAPAQIGTAAIEPGADALWTLDTTPGTVNWPDEQPVELGVRFTTSEAIDIDGVRFYKGDQNVGEHFGTLWNEAGDVLATGAFENETVDGWQDMVFAAPVAIQPGLIYIASYHVPFGYYSADNDYFAAGPLTSGPITALGGIDANGVYHYGSTTEFPEFSFRQSNYWVTPIWSVNEAPSAGAGDDLVGAEGDSVALAGTASDPDGDPLTTTWAVTSGPDDGGACTIADPGALATTISCDDDGAVTVELTVDDGVHPPVSDSLTLTLSNVAPTATVTPSTSDPLAIGGSLSISTAIADPGANDTHVCSTSWGDGASDAGCNGSHSYSEAGVYELEVTATDDDGGAATATLMVVVYDPSAGFVTGGGWFDSPAGAYVADPTVAGQANFGFVSKYKKGASVPTGVTTFKFTAGDLHFKSTDYEWLVVSGSDMAQFKGTGTINDAGSYSFKIWVADGEPDTLRIRIWSNTASGEVVIYDNGVQQAIGGGQIVIHAKKARR